MNEILKLNVKMRLKRSGSLVFTKGKKVVSLRNLKMFDTVTELVHLCVKLQQTHAPWEDTLIWEDTKKNHWLLDLAKKEEEFQLIVSKIPADPLMKPIVKLKWKGSFSSFVTAVKTLVYLVYFKAQIIVITPKGF